MPQNSESLKRVLTKMKGFARGERAKSLGSRLFPAKPEAPHEENAAEEGAESPAHEASESPEMEASEHSGLLAILKPEAEGAKEDASEGGDEEGDLEMAKKLLALLK